MSYCLEDVLAKIIIIETLLLLIEENKVELNTVRTCIDGWIRGE